MGPGKWVRWLNAGLLALLVVVVGLHARALSWAFVQFDDYRQGYIASPLERELYLEGEDLLYQSGQPDAAIAVLERSVRIDPNTEARFFLAESYRARGELSRAAQEYESFLRIDYLHIKARKALIEVYRQLGSADLAVRTAQTGVAIFSGMARQYRPKPDASVGDRYNLKAVRLQRRYEKARDRFEKLAR